MTTNNVMYEMWKLPKDAQRKLIVRAKELSFHWWFDELDCSKSVHRQEIKVDFDEVLRRFDKHQCMSHFMLRRGLRDSKYWEVGYDYSVLLNGEFVSYYLWINVYCEDGEELVSYYKELGGQLS